MYSAVSAVLGMTCTVASARRVRAHCRLRCTPGRGRAAARSARLRTRARARRRAPRSGARDSTGSRRLVTTTSAFCASASASRNSSLRTLLPPPPAPVRSSRLTQISGPPSAALRRLSGCSGVGARQARRAAAIQLGSPSLHYKADETQVPPMSPAAARHGRSTFRPPPGCSRASHSSPRSPRCHCLRLGAPQPAHFARRRAR